ncbi:thymidylate kinase [Fictibacillus phosphorivorans]|uniref:Thymidylate kinase n=1 Tax=Fictibacillus phosphorivorans TaxID=1221500 RepID=A0A165NXN2_9BACL|nr:dTMP kinase [Fictibacillus phosphorivorans]KZE68089.1 thymidylate kinase [Fictibacillus phosphorivorans]
MKGLFITLEGPDGSGKTTQIAKVAEYFKEKNVDFIQTREPGGTRISDKIRALILDSEHNEMHDLTEVLLYAASRAQHVHEKILPALEAGKVVLCDRFVDASLAYQGFGLGVGEEPVLQVNNIATSGLVPDRSYFVDVSPEVGRERMKSRYGNESLDRIEQKDLTYHERVREGFEHIFSKQTDRIVRINGEQNPDEVFKEIAKDLDQLLSNHKEK